MLILIVTISLLVLGNLFTTVLQDFFIFRPKKLKPQHIFHFNEPFREINHESVHQGHINAIWFRGIETRKRLIIYCHGNAGNLDRWGKIASEFCQFDHDVITFDYRGFGKSKGVKSESNFHHDTQLFYDLVKDHYRSEDIVIFGRSMGSGVACHLAAGNPHGKLVLETPFHSIRNLFHTYYPFLPSFLFVFKYRFRNDQCVQQLKTPVYIFQGTKDFVVPYRCAVRLKALINYPDHFIVIKGGKHHNLGDFKLYWDEMKKILK